MAKALKPAVLKKRSKEIRKITQEIKQLKDLVDWFEANHETEDRAAVQDLQETVLAILCLATMNK